MANDRLRQNAEKWNEPEKKKPRKSRRKSKTSSQEYNPRLKQAAEKWAGKIESQTDLEKFLEDVESSNDKRDVLTSLLQEERVSEGLAEDVKIMIGNSYSEAKSYPEALDWYCSVRDTDQVNRLIQETAEECLKADTKIDPKRLPNETRKNLIDYLFDKGNRDTESLEETEKWVRSIEEPDELRSYLGKLGDLYIKRAEGFNSWRTEGRDGIELTGEAAKLFQETDNESGLDSSQKLKEDLEEKLEKYKPAREVVKKIDSIERSKGSVGSYMPSDDGSAVAFELSDSYWSGSSTSGVSYYGGVSVSNGDKELTVQPLTMWRDGNNARNDSPGSNHHVRNFVREEDGTYVLTLESGSGREQLVEIDFDNDKTEWHYGRDLAKLRKQKKVKRRVNDLQDKDLEEACKGFGELLVEKGEEVNRSSPKVIRSTVDNEKGIAALAVGYYTHGYGPALSSIAFYALKVGDDGKLLYQDLGSRGLNTGSGSTWSTTGFRTENFELSGDRVSLGGAIYEDTCDSCSGRWSSRKLDEIDIEKTIGSDYKDIRRLIEE